MNRANETGLSTKYLWTALWVPLLLIGCGSSGTPPPPMKTLTSIQVTPQNPLISVGSSQQFTATGNYSDGSTGDLTRVATWTSSDATLASTDSSGKATGVTIGRPKITAASGGVSASTQLIVVNAVTFNIPRFSFVASAGDDTFSAFTVNPTSGQLRHNGYQLVGNQPTAIVVEPRGKFVYVANSGSSTISAFAIDPSGRLTPVAGSPFVDDSNPLALVVDPSGSFLYSANSGSGTVVGYSINASAGTLTPLSTSPATVPAGTSALTVDPGGQFLFVANQAANNISAFTIGVASGVLTPVASSPFNGGTGPSAVVVDPSGQFLLAANSGSADVSVFSIAPSTGVLSTIAGSPFKTGSGTVISGITVSPNGRTVYVSNFSSGNISALALASNGALTPVAGSPFAVDSDPRALQVDPTGKFAYVPALTACEIEIYSIAADGSLTVVNRIRTRQQASAISFGVGSAAVSYSPKYLYATNLVSNNVSGFSVDASSGALTSIASGPFPTGAGPFGVATDPLGRFVYVSNGFNTLTNTAEKAISGFSVGAGGALTAIPGSPFPAGSITTGLSVDPSGRFLYAANFSDGNLSAYSIDQTSGALLALPGSPFPTGPEPVAVRIEPTGRFLYVGLSSFQIDPKTGALTALAAPSQAPFGGPSDIAADPTGRFLYFAHQGEARISQYSIDPVAGNLTYLGATTPPQTSAAVSLGVDPSGRFVISDFGQFSPGPTINSFAIDPLSGTLPSTPTVTTPAAASNFFYMAIDPSGQFVYVADQITSPTAAGKVWGFTFDASTGSLTPIGSSPFTTGSATISVTLTGTIQ